MKVKKTVAMVVILIGLLGAFAPTASAAPGWYLCTVEYIGMGQGTPYINLTDVGGAAFTSRWFAMDSSYQNQLMAIALTAVSNSMNVMVYTEPAQYSVVSVMYLWK